MAVLAPDAVPPGSLGSVQSWPAFASQSGQRYRIQNRRATFLCSGTFRPVGRAGASRAPHRAHRFDQLKDTLTPSPDRETLRERLNLWNGLVHALQPWRGTPGHEGERWRLITWADETAAVRAQLRSAQRQGTM
ncbi:hypothetical protein [Streptomyces sp. N1]|uniref:hypothetical protein n=1 Tax=Streptomyces sp. N1 TaxID=576456 RepID=UPI00101303F9|nr:hypothetical protein [Streptomyces sp. N1]